MRWIPFLAGAALLGFAAQSAPAQTEHAAFVMTLGSDTVAVDQFVRTPRALDGALLIRIPVTRVATYRARLHENGTIARMEIRWWTPAPEAGPPQPPDVVVAFTSDSAHIRTMQGAESSETTVAAPAGTVPLVHSVYSAVLYQQALVQGFASAGRGFQAQWLALDRRNQVSQTPVTARGADSVAIGYFAGTLVARVDEAGHILGLHGRESTAKFLVTRIPDIDLELLAADFGARDAAGRGLGSMSPRDTARGIVGDAIVTIDYSRPSKRNRVVWGNVVPWDVVWRTGANRATHFSTDRDLTIGGSAVPAGTYTLFTLPAENQALLIVSRQTGQWGTVYREENDLTRIPLTVDPLDEPVEQFTITVVEQDARSALRLEWDDLRMWVEMREADGD
jgi:hypothetical protein